MNLEIDENLLAELEAQASNYWNISRHTAEFLSILLDGLEAKRVLEIGTSNGYSGIWFASVLKKREGKLITIESHAERFKIATKNFERAGLSLNIKQVLGHAPEIFADEIEIQQGDFDFIFLDATKAEHIKYFDSVLKLIKKGGIIVADNVLSHWEKMESYAKYVKSKENIDSIILPIGAGLMISKVN